jgi:hypothetical protein
VNNSHSFGSLSQEVAIFVFLWWFTLLLVINKVNQVYNKVNLSIDLFKELIPLVIPEFPYATPDDMAQGAHTAPVFLRGEHFWPQ